MPWQVLRCGIEESNSTASEDLHETRSDLHSLRRRRSPDEILISGKLNEVVDDIERARTEARAANGWIMDTYLMRKGEGGQA
jgi:hypothetical protein